MSQAVFEKIKQTLDETNVEYELIEHEHIVTSADAARVRNQGEEGLKVGAKAIILKCDGKFYQFVLPGDRLIDMKKVRKLLHAKKLRLATAEEVLEVIDCTVGSIPPFGTLFNIPVFADTSLAERFFFSPGSHEASIRIYRKDWEKVVKPTFVDFGKERFMS